MVVGELRAVHGIALIVSMFPFLPLFTQQPLLQYGQDSAQEPVQGSLEMVGEAKRGDARFNLKTPTLGGKQFWTDYTWRRGWRIQLNALTGHWRLLDDKNIRQAWGDRAHCKQVLDQNVSDNSVPSQECVLLLHGLGRSSSSMRKLGEHLRSTLGLEPIYFEYASTRNSISEHASALAEFVDSLPKEMTINFVCHSMGNIVVRHYIGDLKVAEKNTQLKRIRSMVMLGPPNQGSSIARLLAKTGVFGMIAGEGGLELGPGWAEFRDRLATPHCPFGIVAGKLPESVPKNPLVGGEGDFVVSIEETQLEGASDTLIVPRLHSFLMDSADVQTAVANFIHSKGSFTVP